MVKRNHHAKRRKVSRAGIALYTTKIVTAGALLSDTKTLLSQWDQSQSLSDNFQRFRNENIFGKASRSRVEDILRIFHQRYLQEEDVTKALSTLVQRQFPAAFMDRLLYFHSAKADPLLQDSITEILLPRQGQGVFHVDVIDFQHQLSKWIAEGKTASEWSEPTLRRVARGLLATLRDFGILQGAAKKRIAPAYLPTEAFAYVLFYLKQHQPSGSKLINLHDWKLFFLPKEGVERFLFESHQKHLLEYHAAGTVTRLTFPAETLEEYANVLAERTH